MNNTVAEVTSHPGRECRMTGAMMALLNAARSVQEQLESVLSAIGLSPAKFQALDALVRVGQPIALSELAGHLKCVRSNITQLADRLETDGLIERVDHPSDRRTIRAVVTPLGVERHAAGVQAVEGLDERIASGISAADSEVFLRVLAGVVDSGGPRSSLQQERE